MTDSSTKSKATNIPFTVPRLKAWAKAGGGASRKPIIYRDSTTPGLLYLVRGVDQTSFAFESKLNKKTIRVVMDREMEWTLKKAQDEAIRLKGLINQGVDPRVVKVQKIKEQEAELASIKAVAAAEKLEQQRATILLREIWDAYVVAKMGGWGDRHIRDHSNLSQEGGEAKTRGKGLTKPGVLAPILAMPVVQVDEEVLKHWLGEESKTRANNARQGFEALRSCWRWAAKDKDYKDLIQAKDLFDNEDLLKAKPKRKAASETDVLERAHLADWFKAVQGIQNKEVSVYLQVLLLTGARRNELLGLKWEHIDERMPANIWIHDKVEQEAGRYVPLGPYALWLLNSLPKRKWLPEGEKKERNVEWVFSGPDVGNARIHHDTPGAVHRRAIGKFGLEVSLHGLRRSYASLTEWLEIPSGIVAQIQGHKASAVQERHYKRRPLELLAVSHCRFEAWVLEQAGIEFDAGSVKGALRLVK